MYVGCKESIVTDDHVTHPYDEIHSKVQIEQSPTSIKKLNRIPSIIQIIHIIAVYFIGCPRNVPPARNVRAWFSQKYSQGKRV